MKKLDLSKSADLLIALKAGEARAFNALHREYCQLLIGYSFGVVASREVAEDIVAEAFCKLFVARSGMNSVGHARRFLYMVTRNMSVDHVRSRARERLVDCSIVDLIELSSEDDGHKYEYWISVPDLIHKIYDEVENLPEKCRLVFKLYFYEEMTTAEIAVLLHIHPQTVLNHKSSAVKNLRRRLGFRDFLSPS